MSPVQVGGALDWSLVTAGFSHTCATRSGVTYCWGRNVDGRIGDGSYEPRLAPTAIGSGWSALAAGFTATCGIRDGALECWGDNAAGQLGIGVPWSPIPIAM